MRPAPGAPIMATIHHLSCGTMCPRGARMLSGEGGWLERAQLVCHCLLIETNDGLVLVDTGFGTEMVANPGRLGPLFNNILAVRLRREETALAQIEALGFSAADVRHIVPTHLDVDHAGGLSDFPAAAVEVFATECDAAAKPTLRERPRYPRWLFEHGPNWSPHTVDGDSWFGFESVRVLEGSDAEVALIPVPGHTRGNCAVAVRDGDGWLLNCGDAYFHRGQMEQPPRCPPGIAAFQEIVGLNRGSRLRNEARLNELAGAHPGEVEVFCAHDPVELERSRSSGR